MDGKTVFTSDHALKMEWLPNWIAIIGSGYIGLEFSDVYTALVGAAGHRDAHACCTRLCRPARRPLRRQCHRRQLAPCLRQQEPPLPAYATHQCSNRWKYLTNAATDGNLSALPCLCLAGL